MNILTLTAKLVLDKSDYEAGLASLGDAADTEKSQSGLTKLGTKAAQIAAKAFNAAFHAAIDFGKDVLRTGMDFDTAMAKVMAKLDASGQADRFEEIRNRAVELGKTTKFTAQEVSEGFYYMAIAGWDADEMLAGISGMLQLAAASGTDLGRASDIVTDAMTAFGMTADEAGHFVDVLAAAAANSNTTVDKMGESFKYVAPIAGTFGYTIDDVSVGLGLLANQGIKSGRAGTSLVRIMSNLVNPSEKAANAMEALGVSLFDADGRVMPFADTMRTLRNVFQSSEFSPQELGIMDYVSAMEDLNEQLKEGTITEEEFNRKQQELGRSMDDPGVQEFIEKYEKLQRLIEKSQTPGVGVSAEEQEELLRLESELDSKYTNQGFLQALSQIGGVRGLPAMLAIMQATNEDFDQLVGSVEHSSGTAGRMSEVMLDNLEGDITLLNSALDALKILMFDDVKGPIRQFVKNLTDGVGEISTAFEEGGLTGMLTNLTDWLLNGITGVLTDDSITMEGATEFGRALGTFVGHLVNKLVTSAPEIMSGLFEAGMSLASGIIEGLFAGFMGADETAPWLWTIQDILGDEQDAVDDANQTAAKATGILNYLDSLQQKYGDAATKTEAWQTALSELKQIFPDINQFINDETGALTASNQQLKDYVENSRKAAMESAKMATLQSMREEYMGAVREQGTEEINAEIAQAQADEAWNRMQAIARRFGLSAFDRNASPEQLLYQAQSAANELRWSGKEGSSEAARELETLATSYQADAEAVTTHKNKALQLAQKTSDLATQLDIAERAIERMTQEANNFESTRFTTSGEYYNWYYTHQHASGLNYVPYDGYIAELHRGESVLNANQARMYREGSGSINSNELYQTVAAAVAAAVSGIQVNMDGTLVGNAVTRQVSENIYREQYSRRFAT